MASPPKEEAATPPVAAGMSSDKGSVSSRYSNVSAAVSASAAPDSKQSPPPTLRLRTPQDDGRKSNRQSLNRMVNPEVRDRIGSIVSCTSSSPSPN